MVEKLVRDRIPEIIKAKGEPCRYRIADPAEMPGLLIAKLREEVEELAIAVEADDRKAMAEEIDDIIDVIASIQRRLDAFDSAEMPKASTRGMFERGIVLQIEGSEVVAPQPEPTMSLRDACHSLYVHLGHPKWLQAVGQREASIAIMANHEPPLGRPIGDTWEGWPVEFKVVGPLVPLGGGE